MALVDPIRRVMRFGAFELDPLAGELRKAGLRIRLPDQPLKILMMLLERPGTVVTREELQRELWPEGTFVDFDHSLNTAVNRLRAALGDSAENPRFVQTLGHRGYRFVGMVGSSPGPIELPPRAVAARRTDVRLVLPWAVVMAGFSIVVVVALLFAPNVGGWWERALGTRSRKIRSVAVLPLENLSGDTEQEYFADGMTEELITQLGNLGDLRVISRTSVNQYKHTKKSLQEIARELRVDALVEGTVERSGDHIRVTGAGVPREASLGRKLPARPARCADPTG